MEDAGEHLGVSKSVTELLSQPAELDTELLLDVWMELFYAGAEIVSCALDVGAADKRQISNWQEDETKSLLQLAAEGELVFLSNCLLLSCPFLLCLLIALYCLCPALENIFLPFLLSVSVYLSFFPMPIPLTLPSILFLSLSLPPCCCLPSPPPSLSLSLPHISSPCILSVGHNNRASVKLSWFVVMYIQVTSLTLLLAKY